MARPMDEDAPRWNVPPDAFQAQLKEVHLWRVELDVTPSRLNDWQDMLSKDEQERVRRYRFPIHRHRFIVRRSALRTILSRYLAVPAAAVKLVYGTHGKPALSRPWNDLRFSSSHSLDLAVVAVAHGREVGVDLECVRPGMLDEEAPEEFFSAAEVLALRALPPHRRTEGFFDCWTRKEAYVKAKGLGLSLPLDSFDVSLAPDGPAALLATRPDPQEARRWSIHPFFVHLQYAAALVVEGDDWQAFYWEFVA